MGATLNIIEAKLEKYFSIHKEAFLSLLVYLVAAAEPVNPAVRVQDVGQYAVGHAFDRVADELGRGHNEGSADQEDHGGVRVQPEKAVVDQVLVVPDVPLQRGQGRVDRHLFSGRRISSWSSSSFFLISSCLFFLSLHLLVFHVILSVTDREFYYLRL